MTQLKNKVLSRLDFTPSALREITIKVDRARGINLGQGVCLLPIPPVVQESALRAIADGRNKYSPARGVGRLREVLSERLNGFNRIPCSRKKPFSS